VEHFAWGVVLLLVMLTRLGPVQAEQAGAWVNSPHVSNTNGNVTFSYGNVYLSNGTPFSMQVEARMSDEQLKLLGQQVVGKVIADAAARGEVVKQEVGGLWRYVLKTNALAQRMRTELVSGIALLEKLAVETNRRLVIVEQQLKALREEQLENSERDRAEHQEQLVKQTAISNELKAVRDLVVKGDLQAARERDEARKIREDAQKRQDLRLKHSWTAAAAIWNGGAADAVWATEAELGLLFTVWPWRINTGAFAGWLIGGLSLDAAFFWHDAQVLNGPADVESTRAGGAAFGAGPVLGARVRWDAWGLNFHGVPRFWVIQETSVRLEIVAGASLRLSTSWWLDLLLRGVPYDGGILVDAQTYNAFGPPQSTERYLRAANMEFGVGLNYQKGY
jgi:precorrin-2 methylase